MTKALFTADIDVALGTLPSQLKELLPQDTTDYHFLPADLVSLICQQRQIDNKELGLTLLPLAAAYAVTPISHFNVGAVAFDSEGNAYLGANFEFSDTHIGQTIHAEQSAIANAWACGAKDLALLVINYPPCGHCRQFINEVNLADNFRIQLPDSEAQPLSYYLPQSFGPNDLGISERILGKPVDKPSNADCLSLASHACQHSHAPYSGSHSGIALQYTNGNGDNKIVTGHYAENAAFNPALPPLQMALNTRRLQGKDWRNIEQAVMVETPTTLSQRENTQALLASISHTALQYHTG